MKFKTNKRELIALAIILIITTLLEHFIGNNAGVLVVLILILDVCGCIEEQTKPLNHE